jgi:hypothetical protein
MEFKNILDSLKADIIFYNDVIFEVANEVLDNKISEYPVFVAHQLRLEIGEMILDKEDFEKDWSINATILEELVEKGIILKDRIKSFKEVYKDPRKNICIFLVTEEGGNFIFMPYKKSNKKSK